MSFGNGIDHTKRNLISIINIKKFIKKVIKFITEKLVINIEKKLDARISQIHVLVQIWSIKLAISEGIKWIMYAMDH